jgi:signal transduction histidine kinase
MSTAPTQFHDRLSALEQENAMLRLQLQRCEQAYMLLQTEVAEYRRQRQEPMGTIREQARITNPVICDVDGARLHNGDIVGGWGVQSDITELRQTQQALLKVEQTRAAELSRANALLRNRLSQLSTSPNLQNVLGHLLVELVRYAGATVGHIFIHDAAQNTLTLNVRCQDGQAFWAAAEDEPVLFRSPIPVEQTPIFDYLCAHPQLAILNTDEFEGQMWQGVLEWFQAKRYRGTCSCVLMVGDQAFGMLAMAFAHPVAWRSVEEELILALTQQIALAIQLTRLAEEAKQVAIFEERNRMAGEIHDTLAQVFTGISLQLEVAKPLIYQEPQTVERILKHISQLTKTGLAEARRSIWALYPPAAEYADLAQMLYESVEHMTCNTTIAVEVNVQGNPCPLPPFIGMNLLRIGQEALTNALKHAQAQNISIELTYELDRIWLTICDDGRGFIPPTHIDSLNGGFGLVGMYERCDRVGAQLSVSSQLGQGTQILVEAPLG